MQKLGIWSAIRTLWKIGNKKDKCCFICLLFAGVIRAISELLIPLVTACVISKLSGERAGILGIYFPDDFAVSTLIIICFVVLFSFYSIGTGVRAQIKSERCSLAKGLKQFLIIPCTLPTLVV